jgi:hypothetical protein
MKKFALEKLRSQSSLAFVAAILGFVFLAGAFLKASTPSQLYPVFLFDGIPQNFWSGVVFGVISLELILGTMLITAFYLERGQGTISDFIPVHLPATNDKAIWRKG